MYVLEGKVVSLIVEVRKLWMRACTKDMSLSVLVTACVVRFVFVA